MFSTVTITSLLKCLSFDDNLRTFRPCPACSPVPLATFLHRPHRAEAPLFPCWTITWITSSQHIRHGSGTMIEVYRVASWQMRPRERHMQHRPQMLPVPVIRWLTTDALHCVSKNDTDVAHYNFNAHQPISLIFGTDIAELVRYRTVICYSTSPN